MDDFERPTVVVANGREVIVYKWDDRFVALKNRCPHQNLPFRGGRVFARVNSGSSQSELVPNESEPILVCPVHRYEFDALGDCLQSEKGGKPLRVKSYRTIVRDGRVFVDTRSSAANPDSPTPRSAR